ncbi:FecR family protein [Belliella marina]|uniref:FecR family protein n=1 Tax=Belliella marina TaxID=1644146 RepID=A0ABW4VJV1_9BACT
MGFDPQHESDFLKNPFFTKWVHSPNEHTDRYWMEWCRNNPGKTDMLQSAKNILLSFRPKEEHVMDAQDSQRILDQLILANHRNMPLPKKHHKVSKRRFLVWGTSIAASILLLGVLKGLFNQGNVGEGITGSEITWVTKSVPRGMKKAFLLPDGSRVTLNADSEIRYPSTFMGSREVELKGQAFFEVKKDKTSPFIVKSGEVETKVLGTSFGVRAYPDQRYFQVAVATGLVEVVAVQGSKFQISPNEAAKYDRTSGSLTETDFDYDAMLGWKEKVLKFKNIPISEVFDILSRWYDVQFVVPEEISLDGRYSGRFHSQTLSNVLIGMRYSSEFDFTIRDKMVYVSKKNNQ